MIILFSFNIINHFTDFGMCRLYLHFIEMNWHVKSEIVFCIMLLSTALRIIFALTVYCCSFFLACFWRDLITWICTTTKQYFDIPACCSLYLLYPSQPGVAGGLQVVRGSRPASFSWFLSNNGFNSGWLRMQGHSRLDGACFQRAAGPRCSFIIISRLEVAGNTLRCR